MSCIGEYAGADSSQQPQPTVAQSANIGGNMRSATTYPTYLRAAFVGLATVLAAGCGEASAPASRETGAIEITVATTTRPEGVIDPDGYSLSLDKGASQLIAVDTAMTMSGLAIGGHHVYLDGMASNCGVADNDDPFWVEVRSTSTATVHLSVICWPPSWDY